MSEEKKNAIENKGLNELSDEEINASTVFSKPQIEHNPPKNKIGLSVALKTILALGIVVLLIASTLLINKFFGNSKDPASTNSTIGESSVSSSVKDYTVKVTDYTVADVKSVKIKNSNGEFEFYSAGKDAEEKWYIQGIDKKYINTEFTGLTVEDCVSPKASLSRSFEKDYDYGFDKPTAEFTVTLKSGKEFSATVSETFKNGGISGAYLKCSLEPNNVYIISGESTEYYGREMVYYINKEAPTKIEQTEENKDYFDDSISKVDYAEFSGRNSKAKYRFEMNDRENSTIDYVMVSPYEYPANTERVNLALAPITSNLEAEDIYYFNKEGISQSVLEEYSLDDPDAVLKYKVASDVVTIKIAQSEIDKVYYSVIVNDGPIIYKITSRSFDFLEQLPSYFAAETILLENISGIKEMSFDMGEKTYDFSITSKEDEDGALDIKVKFDGRTIDSENFSNYYYYLLAISPLVSENSIVQTRPEGAEKYFSVKLVHNSKVSDPDLTFSVFKLKDNPSRYYIEMNGKAMGLSVTEHADFIYQNIDDVINNKEIEAMF